MLEKIKELNDQADELAQQAKKIKSGTCNKLASLYDMIKKELQAETHTEEASK